MKTSVCVCELVSSQYIWVRALCPGNCCSHLVITVPVEGSAWSAIVREGCGSLYAIVGINHHGTRWRSQSSCSALVVNNRGRGFESRTKELRTLCDEVEPGSGIPGLGLGATLMGKARLLDLKYTGVLQSPLGVLVHSRSRASGPHPIVGARRGLTTLLSFACIF